MAETTPPKHPSEVQEIERITRDSMTPVMLQAEGYKEMVALPENLQLYDLDDFLDRPRRVKRHVKMTDIETLNRYWDKWADQYAEIFADVSKTEIRMVFDEHRLVGEEVEAAAFKLEPAWRDHKASYECPVGKEWAAWMERDKDPMSQEEFGLFLEDRAAEVVTPDGPDLIAMAAHFTVQQDVNYTKAVRNTDGTVNLAYSQENEASSVIEIPKELVLALAPFHNGVKYEVRARFRYRLNSGNLRLWFEMIEPWRVIEHAFDEVVKSVEEHTSREVSRVDMATV